MLSTLVMPAVRLLSSSFLRHKSDLHLLTPFPHPPPSFLSLLISGSGSCHLADPEKKLSTEEPMEGVAVNVGRGLRGYWSRRGYQRLGNGGRAAPADQAGRPRRRRIRWRRVKVAPRVKLLKLIVRSPKRFLIWLRDAYVKMMMGFATTPVCRAGYGGSVGSFGMASHKEYDQRVIIEIYKSVMVAHGQLVPREAGDPRAGVAVCRR